MGAGLATQRTWSSSEDDTDSQGLSSPSRSGNHGHTASDNLTFVECEHTESHPLVDAGPGFNDGYQATSGIASAVALSRRRSFAATGDDGDIWEDPKSIDSGGEEEYDGEMMVASRRHSSVAYDLEDLVTEAQVKQTNKWWWRNCVSLLCRL